MKHNFWLILCFFACFLFGCQDSTFYKVDERGWSYDSDTNSVSFESKSVPLPGQTIEIDYADWGCGDE